MGRKEQLGFVTFLTVVRFPLVLLFFVLALLYAEGRGTATQSALWFWLGLTSLALSAITDLFDGYFARKFNVLTKFGAHADPLMDKFFYLTALPLLVYLAAMKNGHKGHALFLLVITLFFLMRDQWVTFLRSIGAMYNVSGSATVWGKLRTIVNFPLICAIYYFEEVPAGFNFIPAWLLHGFEAIAFIINFVSIYTYTSHYWPYLMKSADMDEP
jgi:CDP-diacylglycerol--glycerol-3-phosphate 3-phosphatidyltransferase